MCWHMSFVLEIKLEKLKIKSVARQLDCGPKEIRHSALLPANRPLSDVRNCRVTLKTKGFSLDEYHLILSTDPVNGPATLILEEVVIHANALGTVELAFQDGLLEPGVFDGDLVAFGIAPVGIDPVDSLLTLGTGDARQDGAGPLVINIVEEVPAEPVDLGSNDNGSSPGTNGTDDPNGGDPNGQGDGPNQDDPAGPSGLCGGGMVAPLTVLWFGLMGVRWPSRH